MRKGSLAALFPLLMLLPGCIENLPLENPADGLEGLLKASPEPLWDNPQTAPHPLYGFPTLSNPAVGANVPALWNPIPAAPLPDPIQGIDLLTSTSENVPSGAGMTVFGSLAIVPGYFSETNILDISDPAKPVVLSTIPEEHHRNADTIAFPDGRLVAVFSTDSGVLPVWDITNPSEPIRLGEMKPTSGTHKVNIVPGTPIVYNANSMGGGSNLQEAAVPQAQTVTGAKGQTEIYDLSDPENPVLVQEWKNGYGCHHIYFWINEAESKYRAMCAGIEVTQIWDIADPKNPEVIVTIPVHHGNPDLPSGSVFLMAFSHFGILNREGDVLIVGDEMGGGGLAPGCGAATPGHEASTPLGAIWFYDVSVETEPKLLGWFSPGAPYAENRPSPGEPYVNPTDPTGMIFNNVFGTAFSCTAHHGRLVPDPERDLLAMAFYWAGTVLVDFTDPTMPRQVDQFNEGTDTWEVQYYNGFLFTGDLRRGMDVLTFE